MKSQHQRLNSIRQKNRKKGSHQQAFGAMAGDVVN